MGPHPLHVPDTQLLVQSVLLAHEYDEPPEPPPPEPKPVALLPAPAEAAPAAPRVTPTLLSAEARPVASELNAAPATPLL